MSNVNEQNVQVSTVSSDPISIARYACNNITALLSVQRQRGADNIQLVCSWKLSTDNYCALNKFLNRECGASISSATAVSTTVSMSIAIGRAIRIAFQFTHGPWSIPESSPTTGDLILSKIVRILCGLDFSKLCEYGFCHMVYQCNVPTPQDSVIYVKFESIPSGIKELLRGTISPISFITPTLLHKTALATRNFKFFDDISTSTHDFSLSTSGIISADDFPRTAEYVRQIQFNLQQVMRVYIEWVIRPMRWCTSMEEALKHPVPNVIVTIPLIKLVDYAKYEPDETVARNLSMIVMRDLTRDAIKISDDGRPSMCIYQDANRYKCNVEYQFPDIKDINKLADVAANYEDPVSSTVASTTTPLENE